jgi:glyoxylase-like metal-dependent hydrolase (beta-lactamase superfamily II)
LDNVVTRLRLAPPFSFRRRGVAARFAVSRRARTAATGCGKRESQSQRNPTTIYVTHGHIDHFAGLSVLQQRFPGARAIATPESVELMRAQAAAQPLFRKWWPGRRPAAITLPEPYDKEAFTLEGHELRIIRQGRTDAPDSTSLHVPAIDLVVGGDVLYNQCHMYVGDTTPESRENWIGAGPPRGAEPQDRGRRAQEAGRLRRAGRHRGEQALPRRLRPPPGVGLQRPRALRRHDRPVPRLGQPPGMAHVRPAPGRQRLLDTEPRATANDGKDTSIMTEPTARDAGSFEIACHKVARLGFAPCG